MKGEKWLPRQRISQSPITNHSSRITHYEKEYIIFNVICCTAHFVRVDEGIRIAPVAIYPG